MKGLRERDVDTSWFIKMLLYHHFYSFFIFIFFKKIFVQFFLKIINFTSTVIDCD